MSANGIATSSVDYGAPAIRPDIQCAQVDLEGLGTNRFVEPIPMNPREEEAKAFIALFNNLDSIPISDLLPFTADLPVLLLLRQQNRWHSAS